jgi:hypothetical protein
MFLAWFELAICLIFWGEWEDDDFDQAESVVPLAHVVANTGMQLCKCAHDLLMFVLRRFGG